MHILINHQPYYRCNKKSFGGNKYVKQKQLQWYGQQQQQKQFSEQQPEQQPELQPQQQPEQQPALNGKAVPGQGTAFYI